MNKSPNFSYINMITCKFKEDNFHILKVPKVLPCGFTGCLDCIKQSLVANNQFVCPYEKCKQIHIIDDPEKLISNSIIESAIEENLAFFKTSLMEKLQDKFDHLTNVYTETQSYINCQFEDIENEVKKRTETVIVELRAIEKKLLDNLKQMRDKFISDYEKEFEAVKQIHKDFIKIFHENLDECANRTQILKENMYKCEKYLSELDTYDVNIHENLSQIKFLSSNWKPSLEHIGIIDGKNDNEMQKVTRSNIVNLDFQVEKITKMCNINDQYLILINAEDPNHELVVLDENFVLIKRFSKIGSRKFKNPITLCSDNFENIYICDYGNNQVLIVDYECNHIKKCIGKKGNKSGEFKGLIDICYHSNRLYVLDKQKRIQIFSKQGDFMSEIQLNDNDNGESGDDRDENQIESPIALKICNDTLAVLDSNNSVYIYNLDGCLRQIIESEQINSFYLTNNFLFILRQPGIFVCYELNQDGLFYDSAYRILSNSNDFYSDICYFKSRWVFSSCLSGRLSILMHNA